MWFGALYHGFAAFIVLKLISAPPPSSILKPRCANQDCNYSIILFGLFPWVTTGPGFNSISPEVNTRNFALKIQYIHTLHTYKLYSSQKYLDLVSYTLLNNIEQHVQIHHERQLILEISFYALQFLFWKQKHNQ